MPIEGIPTSQDWIDELRERCKNLTDPDDIAKVQTFIDHLIHEYEQDVDSTMDTMAPDGLSHHWGGGPMLDLCKVPGSDTNIMTNEERRPFYETLIKLGGPQAFKFVALETDRFFVGEHGIATDGVLWSMMPADQLSLWGAEIPEGGDPNAHYAIGRRMALFMEYRDGRIVGEDTYFDSHTEIRQLSGRAEAPPNVAPA